LKWDVKGEILLQLFNKSKLRNGTKTYLEQNFSLIVKFKKLGVSAPLKYTIIDPNQYTITSAKGQEYAVLNLAYSKRARVIQQNIIIIVLFFVCLCWRYWYACLLRTIKKNQNMLCRLFISVLPRIHVLFWLSYILVYLLYFCPSLYDRNMTNKQSYG